MRSNKDDLDAYKRAQARRWLDFVKQTSVRLDATFSALEEERDRAMRIKGVAYDKEIAGQTPFDTVADAVIKISSICGRFFDDAERYMSIIDDAFTRFEKLDAKYQAILASRYCERLPWSNICSRIGYTRDGAMKLHAAAVLAAYDVMPIEYRDPIYQAV